MDIDKTNGLIDGDVPDTSWIGDSGAKDAEAEAIGPSQWLCVKCGFIGWYPYNYNPPYGPYHCGQRMRVLPRYAGLGL